MKEIIDIFSHTRSELREELQAAKIRTSQVDMLWNGLYKELAENPSSIPGLHKRLIDCLPGELPLHIVHSVCGEDGAVKYLLRLSDGELIEAVTMQFHHRSTACISTQVGCSMGCSYCATGSMGLHRNLSTAEIVGQIVLLARQLAQTDTALSHIVCMGMGEPLANYDAVMKALDICMDKRGLAIAPRRITVSTVGVVPGIIKLSDEQRPVQLALSLAAATDLERNQLTDAGRVWPLAQLMDACRYYCRLRHRRVFIEWPLIDNVNDSLEHAQKLAALLENIDAHINLIMLNPTEAFRGRGSSRDRAEKFSQRLRQLGRRSIIRLPRGGDIAAGCGQLVVQHTPSLAQG